MDYVAFGSRGRYLPSHAQAQPFVQVARGARVNARPLAILKRLFTHKLEPGDNVELDGYEENSGRIGYTLCGPQGDVKSCGVTPAYVQLHRVSTQQVDGRFPFDRAELELLSKIAWACSHLDFTFKWGVEDLEPDDYALTGSPNDSQVCISVEGPCLAVVLREFYEAIPRASTKFSELHARALEADVMVEPGFYWGRATKSSLWCVGRVLSYESICGPAGTMWHGNEVVPVADIYQLGERLPEPEAPAEDMHPGLKRYRPEMKHIKWGGSGHPSPISASEWNLQCPVGTPVRYWPVSHLDEAYDSRTRSLAWATSDGHPTVKVHGFSGGLSLSHIQKLAATVTADGGEA